jgi:REP element-mobilizing transposase RayT
MILNEFGKITKDEILKTSEMRKEIIIDEFIIMPNHLHLIIIIEYEQTVGTTGLLSLQNGDVSQNRDISKLKNKLSNTIQRIKSSITLNIRKNFEDFTFSWQRSFYDVIIKNEDQLNKSKQYIIDNPLKWEFDKNNPNNL